MDPISFYNFARTVRTNTSEIYSMMDEDDSIGQVDVHFTPDIAYATVVLNKVLDESRLRDLVASIDEQIVASVLPPFDRLDFVVSVFHGSEVGTFSDPDPDEELGTGNGN